MSACALGAAASVIPVATTRLDRSRLMERFESTFDSDKVIPPLIKTLGPLRSSDAVTRGLVPGATTAIPCKQSHTVLCPAATNKIVSNG